MENLLQTLGNDYIWVLVVSIFIIFTVIGYFVDRNQNKKKKMKLKKEQQEEIEDKFDIPEKTNDEIYERINVKDISKEQEYKEEETEEYNTKEMSKSFLKEDNYDLSNLLKESINETKEKQPVIPEEEVTKVKEEPKVDVMTERKPKTEYDRNLEYLLKEKEREKEEPKEEIESIDDFLQRTMREAYHPTEEPVKEKKIEVKNNSRTSNIDYEDTLPIPIQGGQEFSPLEVTVVDPEFYKEYTSKPKLTERKEVKEELKNDVDFKPIEDAILESLGKLSELEDKREDKYNIN